MAAVFAVASLYQNGPVLKYIAEVITFLRTKVKESIQSADILYVTIIMRLMVHYHVVARNLDLAWVCHIKGFASLQNKIPANSEALQISVFVTYESILKLSSPKEDDVPNDGICIDYLLTFRNRQEIQDYGCSHEVLHLLGSINIVEVSTREDQGRRVFEAYSLLARIECIRQVSYEENEDVRKVINKTAESYIHMARVIVYCRLLGYVHPCYPGYCVTKDSRYSRHNLLIDAADTLAHIVSELPTHGTWFTAQYPLGPAFWAIICSPKRGQQCYDILNSMWSDRPTVSTSA
jgi:hypothetical protein